MTTTAGDPVHLASVVAIPPRGGGERATAPDGTYRIEGCCQAPTSYTCTPLPPATQEGLGPANIVLPIRDNGTRCRPRRRSRRLSTAARPISTRLPRWTYAPARWRKTFDFQVTPTNALSIYGVSTYSFPGNGAPGVHPAFLDEQPGVGFVLAYGQGLTENLSDLTVEVLGGDLHARKPQPYQGYANFIRLDFDIDPYSQVGAKHLLFRVPTTSTCFQAAST